MKRMMHKGFLTAIKTSALLLSLTISISIAIAADWKNSFYTDNSSYYLKLRKGGFTQRFRLAKEDCNSLTKAEIVLRRQQLIAYPFIKVTAQSMKKWPKLYGIKNGQFCWFQARVDGIDLNSPIDNDYLIKIIGKSGETLYFSDYIDSLLPRTRIRSKLEAIKNWINLGAYGATVVEEGGVFFKIWEPIAERVDLFINESEDPYEMYPNTLNTLDNKKSYIRYIEWATEGTEYYYKFVKEGSYESLEVANNGHFSERKVDPMARRVTFQEKGGKHNGYVRPRGVVTKNPGYFSWSQDQKIFDLQGADQRNWVIYQLWPATFNPQKSESLFQVGTFNNIQDRVEYLHDLGVTAVEMLPVHETRFHVSWGYALDSLVAIDSGLGSPHELKALIEKFHQYGIRVIFDVVINHVNNDLLREPLSVEVFKTKFFSGNTPWGPMPDFNNMMVRRWMADCLVSLIRDYHVDGFRFDMTAAVHEGNPSGYRLLQELNTLFKLNYPLFYSTAEELPDNVWVSRPISEGGAAFDAQWNDKFKNFYEEQFNEYREDHRWVNVTPLKDALIGYSDHDNFGDEYHFGPPWRTVNYLGSHDFVGNKNPILRIVSKYHETEDNAHNNFYRVRPLEGENVPHNFRLIHNDFTHSAGKVSYGVLFSKPGAVLFYQGEELANDLNLENEWSYLAARRWNTEPTINVDINRYIGSHRMPWEYLTLNTRELNFLSNGERQLFTGYRQFFKDMIAFRKRYPGINNHNADNVQMNHDQSLVTYQLRDGEHDFFVVANFGPEKMDFWLQFPFSGNGGWWREIINSSDPKYGGNSYRSTNIISNRANRGNLVRLGGSTFHVFKAEKKLEISWPLYLKGTINEWGANEKFILTRGMEGVYYTDFLVSYDGSYEFKLATESWEVELGADTDEWKDIGSKERIDGGITYVPSGPNIKTTLKEGFYRFTFNPKSYKYSLEKLEYPVVLSGEQQGK